MTIILAKVKQNPYTFLFGFIGVVYLCNLFIDIMEIDAMQYANMSLEMLQTGSYLQLYDQGMDYIDKPPLIMWLGSLSIYLFGINNFAYKFPALLVLILGIYSTYKFAKIWYSDSVAKLAALLLASCNAYFLMTNDVRTDGILSGFVIFSVWQISEYISTNRWKNLILGAIGVGLAMLSKGPIGLIIVGSALGFDWLVKKQWENIFKWQWVVFVIIIGIVLLPFCHGLYTQFDLHPEKELYNLKQGESGLWFFFYSQSFGRITGENYWKNGAPIYYFFETMAWDLMPWLLLFFAACATMFVRFIKAKFVFDKQYEYVSLFGFIIPFMAISNSLYKLPHYIFPLFSFSAIITANFLVNYLEKTNWLKRILIYFQAFLSFGFLLILAFSFIFFFYVSTPFLLILWAICVAAYIYAIYSSLFNNTQWFLNNVLAFICFSLFMSIYFYPSLLKYQAGSQLAFELDKPEYSKASIYHLFNDRSFSFYTHNRIPKADLNDINLYQKNTLIVCRLHDFVEIKRRNKDAYQIKKIIYNYSVTQLKPEVLFLNTRDKQLTQTYILKKIK
jgi:4-amino-4-deoxy-L-arabinose transferase-like glycosyltransferase